MPQILICCSSLFQKYEPNTKVKHKEERKKCTLCKKLFLFGNASQMWPGTMETGDDSITLGLQTDGEKFEPILVSLSRS